MKNTLLLLSLLVLPFMAFSSNQAQYFSYDREAVEETFSHLNELEKKVQFLSQQKKQELCLATTTLPGLNKPVGNASPTFSVSGINWGFISRGFSCCLQWYWW